MNGTDPGADWEYVNEVARHMYEQHPAMAAANPAAKPAWASLDPASKAYWVKDARLAIQATRLAGAPEGSMAGKLARVRAEVEGWKARTLNTPAGGGQLHTFFYQLINILDGAR